MRIVRQRAYARAGLVGNPSDGYGGRTISMSVRNFFAEAVLYEWEDLELVPSSEDQSRFGSLEELVQDVRLHGYYGGIRLVKATIKKFWEYCQRRGWRLGAGNFSVRYQTNIPRQVGLAGSSAIIVATLRGLAQWYGVEIPQRVQPSLALAVETDELGIAAGLQDRVIQVYEGLVYMDFTPERMVEIDGYRCGEYEPLAPRLLPPMYLAFSDAQAEPTEIVHGELRSRWLHRDPKVLHAMQELAELTREGREALLAGDLRRFGQIMNRNFDIRRTICDINPAHLRMVETARRAGATAKFAGSGGAIVGSYPDEATYARLERELRAIGCTVIRPQCVDVGLLKEA
jgi:glucuronokinase